MIANDERTSLPSSRVHHNPGDNITSSPSQQQCFQVKILFFSTLAIMTPSQKLALENANVKDFVLVERSPIHWFLLFIAKFDVNPLDGVRILVKPLLEPTRQDLWKYQHYGTWMFEIRNFDAEPGPMSVLIQQQDVFTLNPSVEKLRALMSGECLYDGCEDGLVKTTVYTNSAVPWRRSLERIMANDAGLEPKTLCPFCMGWQLFERHEYLASVSVAASMIGPVLTLDRCGMRIAIPWP